MDINSQARSRDPLSILSLPMTQHVEPIMQQRFSFRKSNLGHLKVFAGLDRGCSLTKIIYVDKTDSDQLKPESINLMITFTVVLFHNAHFEEALIWMKKNAILPETKDHPFHVTGAGGVKYNEKIKEILGLNVIFIDEFLAQSRGAYSLLKNVPLEEMVFEEIESDYKESFSASFLTNVKVQFEEIVGKRVEIKTSDDCLPCVFGFIGSGGGFTHIGKEGTFHMASGLATAGKSFMGLCRCILGTNDYKEIMAMAARGDRRNVDSQIKDLIKDDSLYDTFPKDLPIIHMGKLADTNKSIKEFNKDDIAHSLVSLFMYNALNAAIHCCMSEKAGNVFFGGNLFQGEIFRKEFSDLKKMFGIDFVNIYFVNNGHTGALGAMLCSPEDIDKYFKV